MQHALAKPPLVLLCAVALGLIAWAADGVSGDSEFLIARGLGNLPSHWLATAFLIGVICRDKALGAAAGALGLALAVVVYYAAIEVSGDRQGAELGKATQAWLAVALIAGTVFGLAGAAWLSGPQH